MKERYIRVLLGNILELLDDDTGKKEKVIKKKKAKLYRVINS